MLLASFFECVSTLYSQTKFGLLHLEIYNSVCSILILSESIFLLIKLEFTMCNTIRLNLSEDSRKLRVHEVLFVYPIVASSIISTASIVSSLYSNILDLPTLNTEIENCSTGSKVYSLSI